MMHVRQQWQGLMSPELTIAQFVASVALTLASVTVAIVSAIFAYRNNFGWKPIALTTSMGLSGINNGSQSYKGNVDFEIWNRRKYPIVVRYMKAEFKDIPIEAPAGRNEGNWYITATWAANGQEHTIAPQSHEKHKLEFPFKAPSLDALLGLVTITIHYFDPRANDMSTLQIEKVYTLQPRHKGDVVPMSLPLSPV